MRSTLKAASDNRKLYNKIELLLEFNPAQHNRFNLKNFPETGTNPDRRPKKGLHECQPS